MADPVTPTEAPSGRVVIDGVLVSASASQVVVAVGPDTADGIAHIHRDAAALAGVVAERDDLDRRLRVAENDLKDARASRRSTRKAFRYMRSEKRKADLRAVELVRERDEARAERDRKAAQLDEALGLAAEAGIFMATQSPEAVPKIRALIRYLTDLMPEGTADV